MRYSDIDILLSQKLKGFYPDREIRSIGILVAEFISGSDRVAIHLNKDRELSDDQVVELFRLADRLSGHEPVQYVLGETEFFGIKLKVRPGVLIPRGETEELVEWIIKAQGDKEKAQGDKDKAQGDKEKAQGTRHKVQVSEEREEKERRDDEGRRVRILDIGCGSGAIAIALAKHLPGAEVIASDLYDEALKMTMENALMNDLTITPMLLDILHPAPRPLVIPAKAGTSSTCSEASGVISAKAGTSSRCTEAPCHPREGGDLYRNYDNSGVISAKAGTSSRCTEAPCHPREGGDLYRNYDNSAGHPRESRSPAPCALRLAPFDIIVSNPPYIPSGEITSMDLHVVEHEPREALFVPDDDPLIFYRAIAEFASASLNPGGQVFVEINDPMGQETVEIFRKWFLNVELRKDIHGKDRMIRATNG